MICEQTIVVVDDDALTCQSVAAMAASMGVKAQTFLSAEDFLQGYDRAGACCLVLDVRLRGMSGLELLETMQQDGIRIPTIIVTGFADVPMAVRAMKSGAVCVLEKPYRAQELWDAIRQALVLDAQICQDEIRLTEAQEHLSALRADERRILELIMGGKTNKAIAQELALGLRTVESRRQSLMAKLKVDSLAELIKLVTETRALLTRPASPVKPANGTSAGLSGILQSARREVT